MLPQASLHPWGVKLPSAWSPYCAPLSSVSWLQALQPSTLSNHFAEVLLVCLKDIDLSHLKTDAPNLPPSGLLCVSRYFHAKENWRPFSANACAFTCITLKRGHQVRFRFSSRLHRLANPWLIFTTTIMDAAHGGTSYGHPWAPRSALSMSIELIDTIQSSHLVRAWAAAPALLNMYFAYIQNLK